MSTNLKIFFSIFFVFFVIIISQSGAKAQEKKYKIGCVAFYNLENLFDTVNDTTINDEEFLPDGKNVWNDEKYSEKLNNMATVISQIGTELVPTGPSIIGVSEIENKKVLEDLIVTDKLKNLNYQIVHYDSPDKRGVDVGLLYQPTYFTVFNSKPVKVDIGEGNYTRDILLVSGIFNGDTLHVLVNHWPSRSGGQKKSAPRREAAAATCRILIDSLQAINPNAKIIVMGDLNDNPTDKSISKVLISTGEKEEAINGVLYNPMVEKYKKGIGSNAYRDTWSLFDNLIVSEGLLGEDRSTYKFLKATIFSENFLKQKDGKYEGYPFRTFSGSSYQSGYSDHFPVFLYLIKDDN